VKGSSSRLRLAQDVELVFPDRLFGLSSIDAGEHDDLGGNQPHSRHRGPDCALRRRLDADESVSDLKGTISRALPGRAIARRRR
jgi:hypothetical protein